MNAFSYLYAGLRIESTIHVPEWTPFEQPPDIDRPDVVISIDGVAEPQPEPPVVWHATTGGEFCFSIPALGRFKVRGGSEIVVSPVRGVTPDRLRPWLLGSGWASLCYQRGLFLIHASAVMVGDQVVLFCARSRGGKSTIAAQLYSRGHKVFCDDLCNLEIPANGSPAVYPSAARLKLWSDAVGELGWMEEALERDHIRSGKFLLQQGGARPVSALRPRGIYLLEWGELGINRLSGVAALDRFLNASTYRPRLLESAGRLSDHSRQSMDLLRRVPVWELRRPRDLTTAGSALDLLASHWSSE